jgi:hypothetical protein
VQALGPDAAVAVATGDEVKTAAVGRPARRVIQWRASLTAIQSFSSTGGPCVRTGITNSRCCAGLRLARKAIQWPSGERAWSARSYFESFSRSVLPPVPEVEQRHSPLYLRRDAGQDLRIVGGNIEHAAVLAKLAGHAAIESH